MAAGLGVLMAAGLRALVAAGGGRNAHSTQHTAAAEVREERAGVGNREWEPTRCDVVYHHTIHGVIS